MHACEYRENFKNSFFIEHIWWMPLKNVSSNHDRFWPRDIWIHYTIFQPLLILFGYHLDVIAVLCNFKHYSKCYFNKKTKKVEKVFLWILKDFWEQFLKNICDQLLLTNICNYRVSNSLWGQEFLNPLKLQDGEFLRKSVFRIFTQCFSDKLNLSSCVTFYNKTVSVSCRYKLKDKRKT